MKINKCPMSCGEGSVWKLMWVNTDDGDTDPMNEKQAPGIDSFCDGCGSEWGKFSGDVIFGNPDPLTRLAHTVVEIQTELKAITDHDASMKRMIKDNKEAEKKGTTVAGFSEWLRNV